MALVLYEGFYVATMETSLIFSTTVDAFFVQAGFQIEFTF